MNEKEDLKRRMEDVRDLIWETDVELMKLLKEKIDIEDQIAPGIAALKNIEHNSEIIAMRKSSLLMEYLKAQQTLDALEDVEEKNQSYQ